MGSPNLSQLAIILSIFSIALTSSYIALSLKAPRTTKKKASRAGTGNIRPQRDDLQGKSTPSMPNIRAQTWGTSSNTQHGLETNELAKLTSQVKNIKETVEANSSEIKRLGHSIEAIKMNQTGALDTPTPIAEQINELLATKSEANQSFSGYNPILDPNSASLTGMTEGTSSGSFPAVQTAAAMQSKEPYEDIVQCYQDAVDREDRPALRQMQYQELNITNETEDALLRGSSFDATKLEAVTGGGSYVLISSEGHYWLFPTQQTLSGFSTNQPRKGIFNYESEMISRPAVKKPAEVREDGEYWIVATYGVISVPG